MYVGICDDELTIHTQVADLLEQQKWPVPIEILSFTSLDGLLEQYQSLDVLFLDIEVGTENSLEFLAKQQRMPRRPIIVLISSHSNYITRSYQISVFQFLLKPLQRELFNHVFLGCCKQYLWMYQSCAVRTANGIDLVLPLGEIACVKSQRHQISFYDASLQQYYGTASSLAIVLRRLRFFGFCQVHKSYLINLEFVHTLTDEAVLLKTSKKMVSVPIGIKYRSEVKQYYLQYLAMKGNDAFGTAFN